MSLLLDANNLLEIIKKAANDSMDASEPSDFCYGKVTSDKPLKILVEQKMELAKAQLILTRNVTDFETEITVDWKTENRAGGSLEAAYASHNHDIKGRKKILVHNKLKVGDEVVLFKKKGGQKYLVLDRVINL